jgi:hypothetical protein
MFGFIGSVIERLLKEPIDSSLNIASIVLKSFNGTLPVTTGKIHHTINILRLRLRLPRHAAPETTTIQLLSKKSF